MKKIYMFDFDGTVFDEYNEEFLPLLKVLKKAIDMDSVTTYIITARRNPEPVKRYLKDEGISVGVFALGDPDKKAKFIKTLLNKSTYDQAVFFDDREATVKMVRDENIPNLKVYFIKDNRIFI